MNKIKFFSLALIPLFLLGCSDKGSNTPKPVEPTKEPTPSIPATTPTPTPSKPSTPTPTPTLTPVVPTPTPTPVVE